MNRKRVVLILVGLAVLVLGVYVVVRSRGADEALLASGTVEATEAGLGFQVPGRIERVVPNEGDRVRAGDQLAWLDRAQLPTPPPPPAAPPRAGGRGPGGGRRGGGRNLPSPTP